MRKSFLFALVFVFSAGCASASSGTAVVKGTSEGSSVSGTLRLEEAAEGLKVTGEISGLTPGNHGFHIHEKGSCEDAGKAAGDHFNPDAAPHGHLLHDGPMKAHAGDLGNLAVDANGVGKVDILIPQLTLHDGRYNVAGRTVIVHDKEDKFVQPAGDAGGRIGCGQIVVTEQVAG